MKNMSAHYSEEQLRAVTEHEAPTLIVAGPGSGKTTVITEKIKFLIESAGVNPADILVITFTRAAAKEMEGRFKALTTGGSYPVRFGTFHSVFYWIIKTAYNLNNSSIVSEDEKRNIVERIMASMKLSYENKDDIITSVISQISYVKCDMIDIDNYFSRDMPENVFREIYERLLSELKRAGKIDFDDMMVMCYELLTTRQDILNRIRGIYKYILVDEFQDSNKLQYEILKLLAAPLNNVCVVGDDDQSVYGFRGARPEIMRQFEKDFPNVNKIYLGTNYRCDRDITYAAAEVIGRNKQRFYKQLVADSERDGIVKIIEPKDLREENDMLINMVKKHQAGGIPYENQAVLYRTNLQPRRLVYKLEQFNIPYSLKDVMPNIFSHFAVRNMLDYMRLALGDMSRALFLRVMNKPGRYINRDLLLENPVDIDSLKRRLRGKPYVVERLDKLMADLRIIKSMKPYMAVSFIRGFVGYDEYLKEYAEYRQLDVTEFYDVLDEFMMMSADMESFGELFSFEEEYSKLLEKQKTNKDLSKGLRLMTMHGAKGLEFDCVYIIDALEGITPYKKAKSNAELEEERRMFYVAMTRARHELYIFSPKHKSYSVNGKSRYVEDIEKYFKKKQKA